MKLGNLSYYKTCRYAFLPSYGIIKTFQFDNFQSKKYWSSARTRDGNARKFTYIGGHQNYHHQIREDISLASNIYYSRAVRFDPTIREIENNGDVDLSDAILALQIMTGSKPSTITYKEIDVNGDGKISLEEAIYVLQVLSAVKDECKEPLDEETLNQVLLSFESSVEMQPGQTYNFHILIVKCCVYLEPVEGGCPVWSVSPAEGATIDPKTGTFTIDPSTPPGTIFTVSAKVTGRNAYREGSVKVHVFTSESNPFVGIWREKKQIECDTGVLITPTHTIGEIRFQANGQFSVTWFPFEVYIDYWGTCTYDLEAGELIFNVEGGNFIPNDIDGAGSFYFNEKGQLILENNWLGSNQHAPNPVACGHLISRE